MKLDVRSNVDEILAGVQQTAGQQTSVVLVAMNRTLAAIKQAELVEMARAFDRPTPYTMGALFTRQAQRNDLTGEVWVKDARSAGKGTPATKYLLPEVEGGDRGMKRFERALYLAGILPNGMYAVPGEAAKRDAYGNMAPSQIVQLLSYFRAFPEQGYRANITDRGRARKAMDNRRTGKRGIVYFALRSPRNGLLPGVYSRRTLGFGSEVRPILVFVDGAPNYERRFDWYGTASKTAATVFPRELVRAQVQANERRAARAAAAPLR